MKKALAILIFVFTGSIFAFADPGNGVVFINGQVTDKQTHETLSGVEVSVKGTSISTYTDLNGNFFLSDLPEGNYELEFHFITYDPATVTAGKATGEQPVNVQLEQR